MKKIEIKKFIPKTVFKSVLFLSSIPILALIIFSIINFTVGTPQNKESSLLVTILYLVFSPLAYGLVAMVLALSYNWFASKFGGLVVEISEKVMNKEIKSNSGVLDEAVGKKI